MDLTDYLAVYGALLSTAVFLWSAARARPKVRVRLCFSVDKDDAGEYQSGVGIFVQKPSAHTVHINHIGLLYPWRRATLEDRIEHVLKYRRAPIRIGWCHTSLSNYDVDARCPASIEPGQSHYVFVDQTVVEGVLKDATARVLIAEVQDALWRRKYSKRFAVDVPKPEETS